MPARCLRQPCLWHNVVISLCVAVVSAAPSIRVNTTSIHGEGWVNVSFEAIPASERSGAWIAVISPAQLADSVHAIAPTPEPATPPWISPAPIKYISCQEAASRSFNSTGQGWHEFRLVNMRADVAFVLLFGGLSKPTRQVASRAVSFIEGTGLPMHGHIARTQDPTEMRVMWVTDQNIAGQVRWGFSPGDFKYTVNATADTYTQSDLCGTPATAQGWRNPGVFHSALVANLIPSQRVYYVFGSEKQGWSREHSFVAAQLPSAELPVNLLIVADMGVSEPDGCHYHWEEPDAWQTMQHMYTAATDSDIVLHVGDISYATGYSAKWDLFMSAIENISTTIPYMTGQGNHERDFPGSGSYFTGRDSGGECGVPTQARFIMPTPSKRQDNGWYSIDQGSVHIVTMDTEMACSPGSEQYTFIQNDLSKVNRSVTPWVIFTGHRPMYSASSRDKHFGQIEGLLYKYQVDLVLWGHIHYAAVTCPVYNGTCVKPSTSGGYDAPIHTVIGNAGQGLTPTPSKPAAFNKYVASEWGYERIFVHNSTHLTMKFYSNKANTVHYSFDIVRSRSRYIGQ